jgi:Zn-dependent metalloprotease
LNESFSDVFGSLVKQWSKNQAADQADWLIGEGLFTPKVKGKALRSMKSPGTAYDDPVLGKDPQPADMSGFYTGTDDDGGVHINSGIPNRAFYLAATAIGGFAWEKAGLIWYTALRDRLRHDASFATAAAALVGVARELFGENGGEQRAVSDAWTVVGVLS